MNGFEGLEEATILYYPATNTFQNDASNYANMVDVSPGMIRTTLRNYQPTLGWWDGDRGTTNDDRQRTEVKGIDGLAHQKQGETFEYSFDFRTNAGFMGTSHFCHIFQLKQTENGSSGSPLVTVSLYKNGSVTEGRIQATSDGRAGTDVVRTFSFAGNTWNHVVVRITPTDDVALTGAVLGSVNGDAFAGLSNVSMWSNDGGATPDVPSNDYRTKFGLYRGIGTSYGVPAGDSWIEHRTVTGYAGASKALTWKGGVAGNTGTWDNGVTANFLNGAAASTFNSPDQVVFDNSSTNTSVTLAANVSPNYVRVNSSQNYTFGGAFGITGGTLRKDGTGTLTLATTNSYPGLTDVRAGTLLVTGSIGNNSLASVSGGTLKAGSANALGTNSTIGTEILGSGTLDINGFNLSTEPISVTGSGVSSAGAIMNSGAAQTTALNKVTLTGDATFGGSGRWDLRGSGATLSTGGAAYNLTKTGANQVSFVGTNVDAALGNITVNAGMLSFQTGTSSMGDATKSVTVASGATLGFYNTVAPMTKVATLNGGRMLAESGTGTQNTFSGPVTLGGPGGIFEAAGGAVLNVNGSVTGVGPLTKNGAGLVTLGGANTYTGSTNVNAGTLVLAKTFRASSAVNVANGATMELASSSATPNNVVLKTPQLNVSAGGLLDVRDNKLIVTGGVVGTSNGTTYSGLSGAIQSGLITTTMPDAAAGLTALGVASAADAGYAGGTFGGVSVGASDAIVMYTYAGDANLDGFISGDDYSAIDFNILVPGSFGWLNGDFNYDGGITGDDYSAIDFNLIAQGAPFPVSAAAVSGLTAVPEPAAGFAALVAGVAQLTRRRRRGGRERA
jgi:autotransporter-associated beta strand protein